MRDSDGEGFHGRTEGRLFWRRVPECKGVEGSTSEEMCCDGSPGASRDAPQERGGTEVQLCSLLDGGRWRGRGTDQETGAGEHFPRSDIQESQGRVDSWSTSEFPQGAGGVYICNHIHITRIYIYIYIYIHYIHSITSNYCTLHILYIIIIL